MNTKHILVPVDYSKCSELAVRYAARITGQSDTKIILYHAFYSPAYDLIELTGNKQTQDQLRLSVTRRLLETEKKDLNKFLEKVYQYPELQLIDKKNVECKLEPGLPMDKVVEAAERIQPGFVIMGTRGADKKSQSLLGSVTEIALRKIKLPLLAIPEDFDIDKENIINRMVYLTDFDESDFSSISYLFNFIKILNLEIHCIHIGNKSDSWDKIKMNGLRQYFKNVYQIESIVCEIIEKKQSMVEALDRYVIENNIDIISLTTKKRKLYEKVFKPNVTKKLFYHTNIPLMVFHS